MNSQPPRLQLCKKAYKLVTQPRGSGLYRDEIEIKESHSNHRKLDS